ncbi:hypothetical protein BCR43DRAFT_512112 [Syncephalastrum racemosum]|uniref:Homeobox domain-containing protein n=1 Tax=Syncephalastrum racemosum TaxID=13706 RepID=A0A1X2HPE7_SYNRA|nr:hypothetical protein BCR43DRAFT_512112 [Syncephalastrum racemosum]
MTSPQKQHSASPQQPQMQPVKQEHPSSPKETSASALSNSDNKASSASSSDEKPATAAAGAGGNNTPARKRTRATAEQLAVLEDTFAVNVSPNSKLRKQLAERLQMSERSIQIWFQNRRAKVKHMQKRAQMQMQQASIRAQLYHYHQQQQQHQQYGAPHMYGMPPHHPHHQPPLVPLPPQQQPTSQSAPQDPYYRPYPLPHEQPARMPLPRAQSVDAAHSHACASDDRTAPSASVPPQPHHHHTPWGAAATPSPSPPASSASTSTSTSSSITSTSSTFPATSSALTTVSDAMPTLVPVPDAGPTAMLATPEFSMGPTTPPSTYPDAMVAAAAAAAAASGMPDLWCSPEYGAMPVTTTIDPSSLIMTPPASQKEDAANACISADAATITATASSVQLSATTLAIGSWHRLKLRSNDLVCSYEPEGRTFAWQIGDNHCFFKMEISVDAVASIEYVSGDVLADVHFDMSEPPLFYMQQNGGWVQCSDFTEGKQASRFFRHSLKGVAHHLKQELVQLTQVSEQTRRLVRFLDQHPPVPVSASQAMTIMPQPFSASSAETLVDPSAYSYYCWDQPPPPQPVMHEFMC